MAHRQPFASLRASWRMSAKRPYRRSCCNPTSVGCRRASSSAMSPSSSCAGASAGGVQRLRSQSPGPDGLPRPALVSDTTNHRVHARYERYDPPRSVLITNVLGDSEPTPCPGHADFELEGASVHLLVTDCDEEGLFRSSPISPWEDHLSTRPVPGHGSGGRRAGDARFQPCLQPAMRVLALRHMPAATRRESSADRDRGRRAVRSRSARRMSGPIRGMSDAK